MQNSGIGSQPDIIACSYVDRGGLSPILLARNMLQQACSRAHMSSQVLIFEQMDAIHHFLERQLQIV